ncbi:uncharacterized protein LOC111101216 isoform X2 [Crassostrea virginica]
MKSLTGITFLFLGVLSAMDVISMTTVPMNNQTSYTTDNKTTKGDSDTTVSVITDKTTKTSSSSAEEGRDCPDFQAVLTVAVTVGVVLLLLIWCLCMWYRRKIDQLQKKLSQGDAEKGSLKLDVNGRKISVDHFSAGRIDKDPSSLGRSMHDEEKEKEDEDRMSDLYDVTDPDYAVADGEALKNASKANADDVIEDSEYDLLNDDDKSKKRDSDYACAEFRTSDMNLDCDTYDTTETWSRIKSEEKVDTVKDTTSAEDKSSDETKGKDNLPGSTADKLMSSEKETDKKLDGVNPSVDSTSLSKIKSEEKVDTVKETTSSSEHKLDKEIKEKKGPLETTEKETDKKPDEVSQGVDTTSTSRIKSEEKVDTVEETTSSEAKSSEETKRKDILPEVNAKSTAEKHTSNEQETDKKPDVASHKSVDATLIKANDSDASNKNVDATILKASDDGAELTEPNEPGEKVPKLSVNGDTKPLTFEYELVKLVQDQGETDPKASSEETPVTSL